MTNTARAPYVVTGGCECGQPSTVTYRTSRGTPIGEACDDCNGWRPKTLRHQGDMLVGEWRHFVDAFHGAVGIRRLMERIARWLPR